MIRSEKLNAPNQHLAEYNFQNLQNKHPYDSYIIRSCGPDALGGWSIYYTVETCDTPHAEPPSSSRAKSILHGMRLSPKAEWQRYYAEHYSRDQIIRESHTDLNNPSYQDPEILECLKIKDQLEAEKRAWEKKVKADRRETAKECLKIFGIGTGILILLSIIFHNAVIGITGEIFLILFLLMLNS